ncbi:hypothetical protein TSOC_009257 [Tetrabaena socialis]|uniref:Uncharacterized protein n=1 Tax=Tetrabaena socialis TaxID=47790 RepID=A0A2J7ZWD5_9CHLO|nr:hypothetical protein TSOC_009257 [Tetrabaena socialis]|eukprot:PNH04562.1 hypothetical protein TSOC_009257 [Tetrabaena socialis]
MATESSTKHSDITPATSIQPIPFGVSVMRWLIISSLRSLLTHGMRPAYYLRDAAHILSAITDGPMLASEAAQRAGLHRRRDVPAARQRPSTAGTLAGAVCGVSGMRLSRHQHQPPAASGAHAYYGGKRVGGGDGSSTSGGGATGRQQGGGKGWIPPMRI